MQSVRRALPFLSELFLETHADHPKPCRADPSCSHEWTSEFLSLFFSSPVKIVLPGVLSERKSLFKQVLVSVAITGLRLLNHT